MRYRRQFLRSAVLDIAVLGLDQVGTTEFYLESKEVLYVSLPAYNPFCVCFLFAAVFIVFV